MNFRIVLIFLSAFVLSCNSKAPKEEIAMYDVCIYGGNSAGVIAAVTASRLGKSVLLIEPGSHLGGLSAGGLGKTDIGDKDVVTGIARDFYRRLGAHYGKLESWWFEPKEAEKVFNDYVKEANIEVVFESVLSDVVIENRRIKNISFMDMADEKRTITQVAAQMFLDCTYEGDLMAKSGVSYFIGRESNDKYGEQYNGVQLVKHNHQFPDNVSPYVVEGDSTSGLLPGIVNQPLQPNGTGDKKLQAYNYRLCLTHDSTNLTPFYKPENYNPNDYELLLRWLKTRDTWRMKDVLTISGMPNGKTDSNNRGAFSTDFIGQNWDYPEANYERRQEIIEEHANYTKGFLYFLANDSNVPEDMRKEAKTWGYAKDEFVDNGNFPHQLYVREARRMIGEYVMTEHSVMGKEVIEDGVGKGAYGMDSHYCQRVVINGMVKNEGNINIEGFKPYPIAYRSITPKQEECENLLVPVALSASHIAYGSIRMEPVFMVLGQSAAMAAAMAIDENTTVQGIDVTKLQARKKNDPLLNGTPAAVLIDDANTAAVEALGNWEHAERFEIPTPYKGTYFISREVADESLSVKFHAQIEKAGKYKVYVYHPIVIGWRKAFSSNTVFRIKTKSSDLEKSVDFTQYPIHQNWGEWVELGTHEFSGNEDEFVELLGGKSSPPLVADAVIFVWAGE